MLYNLHSILLLKPQNFKNLQNMKYKKGNKSKTFQHNINLSYFYLQQISWSQVVL